MPNLTKKLTGLLFGDKGYIKKDLFHELFDRGLKLVTSIKKGMKNSLMALNEKILLRKRSIIETVLGSLKNKFEIEHTRHRSPINFLVHIFLRLFHIPCSRKSPAFLSFTSLANPQLGYIGLTPRQYSSGEVDRHGSTSKMGPAECRSMLYEAAQTMLTVTKRTFKLKNWGCEEKRNEKSNCSSSKKISCNYA